MKQSELRKIIKEELLKESLKSDWNKLSAELANPLAKMNLFVSRNAMPQNLDAGFVKAKKDLENMILKIDKFFRGE